MDRDYCRSHFDFLIAKTSGNNLWLPFWAHQADTAGTVRNLILNWLPAHIRNYLDDRICGGMEGEEPLYLRLSMFLAYVHDIGKATSVFQSKISSLNPELVERLQKCGFSVPSADQYMTKDNLKHSYAGESILLKFGCNPSVAAVVGCHHGTPFSGIEDPEDLMEFYEDRFYGLEGKKSDYGRKWEELWDSWISFSLQECGFSTVDDLPEIDVPSQTLITGLLIIADWISSNPEYASLLSIDEESNLDYPERWDSIWKAVGFPDQWLPTSFFMSDDSFAERFGFMPNAIQREIVEAAENADSAGIYILEAQMGQGKTEAALAAAEILASKTGCEGIFFGLPTQATSNGLFPRISSWALAQSESAQLSIRLAHGAAMLLKGYREMFHGTASQEEDNREGLIVHSWFEGRKQALLASFVTGTVDQLLLAALKQKHVMLRHIGLAGKVVVIDECHAYDAYMNRYLDRVLEWLGAYHVPVILLSATLPLRRRSELIEAYTGENYPADSAWKTSDAYPVLTYYDGSGIRQSAIHSEGRITRIRIVRDTIAHIPCILHSCLYNGGAAGVILNTVSEAQKCAESLRNEFPSYNVILIHARFTMDDRGDLEAALLRRIGKKSEYPDRNVIVVGTQILEQSLDIDFDVLITQLAPIDLLLQRMGRLHRHERTRPESLNVPICYICGCENYDDASVNIYGEWLLKCTDQNLGDGVILPKDIPHLVQKVYSDPDKENPDYQLWKEAENRRRIKERKAEQYRIPDTNALEDTIHGMLSNDAGNQEVFALARVRDSEPQISVCLMIRQEDEYLRFVEWRSEGERLSCDHVPSQDECLKILRQRVSLPRLFGVYHYDQTVNELEEMNRQYLMEWQRSGLLRGELILLLDENCHAFLCGFGIRYDRFLGFLVD